MSRSAAQLPKSPANHAGEAASPDEFDQSYRPAGGWRAPPAKWPVDTAEALLAIRGMREVIAQVLGEMPVQQGAALTLRDIEGLSLDQICNILEISAPDARLLLHRARRRLWSAIGDYLNGSTQ